MKFQKLSVIFDSILLISIPNIISPVSEGYNFKNHHHKLMRINNLDDNSVTVDVT